jgi:hypothetical protein
MEKGILKFILLLTLVIWQGNLFLSSSNLAHAHATFEKVEAPKDKYCPQALECLDEHGEVYSYGGTCVPGSFACTPNDCPLPNE